MVLLSLFSPVLKLICVLKPLLTFTLRLHQGMMHFIKVAVIQLELQLMIIAIIVSYVDCFIESLINCLVL